MPLKTEFQNALLKIDELYPAPQVMSKAVEMMKDPDLEANRLVDLLKTDASLTAEIVKLSNSAYYGFAAECTNLTQAVSRIGFYEVLRILNLSISKSVLARDLDAYGITALEYWSQCASTALLMERFSPIINEDPNDTFTVGILHAIGRVLINQLLNDFGFSLFWDGSTSLDEWEVDAVGFNHAYAGSMLLKRWNFPNQTCGVILNQMNPERVEHPSKTLLALNFAIDVVEKAESGFTNKKWEFDPEHPFIKQFSLSEKEVRTIVDETRIAYEDLSMDLGIGEEEN